MMSFRKVKDGKKENIQKQKKWRYNKDLSYTYKYGR